MRTCLSVLLLVILAFSTTFAPWSEIALIQVETALKRSDPNLQRIEVHRVPGRPDLFAAVCDTETHWWGTFCVLAMADGNIAWTATFDGEGPTEQSILRIRPLRLKGFSNPLIEVFGTTHMGHGDYYLYELRGRTLKCLLKTFAVDSHADCNLIRGDALNVSYTITAAAAAATEITFTGIIDEYDDGPHNRRPIASNPCRKVFRWQQNEDRFVEEKSQRCGFEAYPDRQ
jgi:hypothetical protein